MDREREREIPAQPETWLQRFEFRFWFLGILAVPVSSCGSGSCQWTAKGASGKGPRQHTSKIIKTCQNVSFFFDIFRPGQKTSKSVKSIFGHFSTVFAQHQFSGPFWGPLVLGPCCMFLIADQAPCVMGVGLFCRSLSLSSSLLFVAHSRQC